MAQQFLNRGAAAGDHTGTKAREGARIINENFEEVYGLIDILTRIDIITDARGFSISGTDVTVNANWEWYINNQQYANTADVVLVVDLSSSGKIRKVYVVPNGSNSFSLIEGDEAVSNPPTPELPNGGMYVTYFEVSDSGIGAAADPYNGDSLVNKLDRGNFTGTADDLVDKNSYSWTKVNSLSGVVVDYVNPYVGMSIDFHDAVTELQSLSFTTLKRPYFGALGFIKNSQTTDILIKHQALSLVGGRYVFSFPDEQDLILKPNQILFFKANPDDTHSFGYLDAVGIYGASIDESNLMHLTGGETIDGNKVFLQPVSGVTATADEHLVTKAQMDTADTAAIATANTHTDTQVSNLINGEVTYDTLKKLADELRAHAAIIGGTAPDGDSVVNTVTELLAVMATFPEGVDLATLLAGKVNVSDVYNALDCVVSGKVADARQLKVLNDAITALTSTVSGKEDSSNKTDTMAGNTGSSTKYLSTKGVYDWAIGLFQTLLVSGTNIKTINGSSILGSGNLSVGSSETTTTIGALIGSAGDATPNDSDYVATALTAGGILKKITWTNVKAFLKTYFDTLYAVPQITITTSVSITTDTLDASSYSQKGRNVVVDNSTNAINITVNGGTGFCASYVKHGTGAITFVQGSGRTLTQVDGTAVLNGAVGSTATISSVGTKDYLRISNA